MSIESKPWELAVLNATFISILRTVMPPIRPVILLVFATHFVAQSAYGQEEVNVWDVPWTIIGDSASLVENQTVPITGLVVDQQTGEPLSGASVSVDVFKHYDYTDKNGAYFLDVPPGTYKIKVRHVGMVTSYIKVRVLSRGTLHVHMTQGIVELNEIMISSRPIDSNIKQSLPGLTKLNVQEIKTLPTLTGELDIVKSLQLMPGITSVGEGSSGFNVRGGRTDQNLVLLNDVPLFSTAHALGFVSAINQDVIQDFSLYKGNVPSNFGGRAASVLDVTTRRGNFEEWKIQGGVGPVSSRLTAEGPLDSMNMSVLISGRVSHSNWVLQKVSDPDVSKSRLTFYDGFAKITRRFSPTSSAEISYYGSHDRFQFANSFGYLWSTQILSGKWQSRADKKTSPIFSASYGRFKSSFFDPSGPDRSQIVNTLNYIQLKEDINYIPNDRHEVVAGISAIGYLPRPEIEEGYQKNPLIDKKSVGKKRGLETAIYINDDFELSEIISVSAGIRYSYYAHIGPDTVFHYLPGIPRTKDAITDTTLHTTFSNIRNFGGIEPRFSVRINTLPNQSVKMSYNRMRQYIHQISNTTAPTPIDLWLVSNEHLPPQIADNFSLGYFWNIKDNRWETSLEGFVKNIRNLVEYKDFPELLVNNHIETEFLTGKGRAYGAELYLRRLKGKWTGWLAYTYSRTSVKVSSPFENESINEGQWFPGNYDKPHNLNLVINRSLIRSSALSMIFSFNTGRPFTGIESSYLVDDIVVPIYSARNKYRIPNYYRLDLSCTIGKVIKSLDGSLVFAVYNLFGRDNAYSVFYKRPEKNYFIPKPYKLSVLGAALPSLTYNFRF